VAGWNAVAIRPEETDAYLRAAACMPRYDWSNDYDASTFKNKIGFIFSLRSEDKILGLVLVGLLNYASFPDTLLEPVGDRVLLHLLRSVD
jgi:hypothetical protein